MWGTGLELALKFVGWFIEKKRANEETKKKFMELIDTVKDDAAISVKIKNSLTKQKETLKKRLEDQKKAQQTP